MFERTRAIFAEALTYGRRLLTDPRWPSASRVPRSRTVSNVVVTPDTAVTIPAVWACLRYLSQTPAVLPWRVMQDVATGTAIVPTHPIDFLLNRRPSDEWSAFQFRETLTHWALRWGNGYAEIEPTQGGRPYALWPVHPERVLVCRALDDGYDNYGELIPAGSIYYEIGQGVNSGSAGASIQLLPKRIFHIRGFGEGPVGVNVITYAAESLGWVKAAQLFGASFFGNGANVSMVVVNKTPLKKEGLARQRQEFENLYKGLRNSSKTAFLDNDADIKPLGIDAKKAQMIETNQALVADVCRWFGVPPHKVMDLSRATFSNIEHQAIEVVVDSVAPWVKRFEDEADFKLLGPENRNKFYSKIDMRALMRGDTAARMAYYDGMVKVGAFSPNRVLQLEGENTIGPKGDVHTIQSQNITLEQVVAISDQAIAAAENAAANGEGTETDPGGNTAADPGVDPGEGDSAATDALDRMDRIYGEGLIDVG